MLSQSTQSDCPSNNETCISDLPDECLSLILKFIVDQDAFALTCHRWLRIQRTLKRSIKISCLDTPESAQLSYVYLRRIFDRFPALQSLSLCGCTELPDGALVVLGFAGSRLQNLSLDCCFSLTNKGLAHVGHGCSSLSYLSMYRCNIDNDGLEYIAKGCRNLNTLNISYCHSVSDSGIAVLCQGCPRLKVVNITSCINIQGQGFQKCFSLQFLEAEACRFTDDGLFETLKASSLQYLNLSHLRNGSTLGPQGFRSIGISCYNLQFLYLRMCRTLENSAVIAISKGCPLLKEWNMAVCPQVSVAGWMAVSNNCKNLEILHANRCRHFCIESMLCLRDGCPKLQRLYLHGCPKLTDTAIELFKQVRSTVRIIPHECMPEEPYIDNFIKN